MGRDEEDEEDDDEGGECLEDDVHAKGYSGDRSKKWIPPHNVAQTGPVIDWQRGREPRRAVDFFLLFFPLHLMQVIIDNSNLYAVHGEGIGKSYMSQVHNEPVWRKINLMEFKRFLACLLYIGIVKAPARENY